MQQKKTITRDSVGNAVKLHRKFSEISNGVKHSQDNSRHDDRATLIIRRAWIQSI